jgi:hypothetical protein
VTVRTRIEGVRCGYDSFGDLNESITIDDGACGHSLTTSSDSRNGRRNAYRSSGSVLAELVRTCSAIPPFDTATMDDYAIGVASLAETGS